MDRVTLAAIAVACASVAVSAALHPDVALPVRHAAALVIPLTLIAFPSANEAGFRSTFRGVVHGGEGPTPAALVRIAAWVLLVILVVVHHAIGSARVAA